jgi:transcriptional regulator with XRE-family HTH domain
VNDDQKHKRARVLNPNRLVGYNLGRARRLRGWTQAETVERLKPFLRKRWSVASYSHAEKSATNDRIRRFSADELVAFAQTFDLPVTFFLLPVEGLPMWHPSIPLGKPTGESVYPPPEYEEDIAGPTASPWDLLDLLFSSDGLADRLREILRSEPDILDEMQDPVARQVVQSFVGLPPVEPGKVTA